MERLRVLVTGATGRLGGAVARQLIERGHEVQALTGRPDSAEAERLDHLGARIVRGDLGDPASVRAAAERTDAVFLTTSHSDHGAAWEARHGVQAVEALAASGTGHIVYESVAGARDGTGVPHLESKARIEQALADAACPFTVLAPAFYRDNLLSPLWRDGLQQGMLAMAVPSGTPLENVEVDEVARMVCRAMEEPARYRHATIPLASDRTTPRSMARILGRTTGRAIAFCEIPLADLREQDPASAATFAWLAAGRQAVDIRALRRQEPEVEWRSFVLWAESQPWTRLLAADL